MSQVKKAAFDPANPNKLIDRRFNYSKLSDPTEFEAYLKYCEELCPYQGITDNTFRLFDFELYRCKPIIQERYPGLPNSPKDFVGLIVDEKRMGPVITTRISFEHARNNNAQILNAHSLAGHGKYYLLKMPA